MKIAFVSLDTTESNSFLIKKKFPSFGIAEIHEVAVKDCISAASIYDIIVFTKRVDNNLSLASGLPNGTSVFGQISNEVLDILRNHSACLLLDNSFERLSENHASVKNFHASIKESGVNPKKIVVATTCWNLESFYSRINQSTSKN